MEPETAARGLGSFSGAARRFEPKGEVRGVRVFDDYAHHPTEVAAALQAARAVAGSSAVHVLFQPHLFSRTRNFAAEFAQALDLADSVTVLPIYPAREDPIPGVTSELITSRLKTPRNRGSRPRDAVQDIAARAAEGDIILTVGAGDVTQYGAALVEALRGPAPGGSQCGCRVGNPASPPAAQATGPRPPARRSAGERRSLPGPLPTRPRWKLLQAAGSPDP